MPQVQSSLAYRLASLIDGVVSTEDVVPAEYSFDMPNATQDDLGSRLLVMTPVAPPVNSDELADVRADAYAAGWTMPLLQEVAMRLLEQSSMDGMQHPGVAPKRLRIILPEHLKAQYLHVLRWFDAAHVLAPAVMPTEPFRHPRPLVCSTVDELIMRLLVAPYPEVEDSVLHE